QSIGVMLLNRFLLPFGNDKIAAMGIVSKIVMIVIMIMVAFSFGGQPLYGYLYGSDNKKRMKETIRFAYMLVCGTGLAISVILFAIAPVMIHVFMKDAAIVSTGAEMLRAVLCGMPFIGYSMVTTCIFQSTGKASGALLLSAGRQGYIYAAVIFIASALFQYKGVIYAQAVSDILTAGLAFVLFRYILGSELSD
ncbi:MAG: MATE family efflux transporter, partial [Solobacterium sp.]|nr:MATE family efflux transporter [Solobacterium sp.]